MYFQCSYAVAQQAGASPERARHSAIGQFQLEKKNVATGAGYGKTKKGTVVMPVDADGNEVPGEPALRLPRGDAALEEGLEESEEALIPLAPKIPEVPTEREREGHELTHYPFRSWCYSCVRGKAKERGHRSVPKEKREIGNRILQIDYS